MPLSLFCPKCGEVNEYTLTKPKFCHQCGNPFSSISTSAAPINKSPIIQPQIIANKEEKKYDRDEDGIYEVITEVPKIDKLSIEIDIPSKRKITIGDLCPKLKKEYADKNNKIVNKIGRPKGSKNKK